MDGIFGTGVKGRVAGLEAKRRAINLSGKEGAIGGYSQWPGDGQGGAG